MTGLLAATIARATRLVTGANVRAAPPGGPGPFVYFANHESHLDFLAIWSVLEPAARARTRPVAARDYWEATRLRRRIASGVFNAVLVDRGQVALSERARQFDQMTAALDAGDSLILFPEGARSAGASVQPFRSGLFHLGRKRPGAVLVPVHLDNMNRILPRGEFLLVPLACCVTFGAPIRLGEGEARDAFLARARAAVLALGGDAAAGGSP
jgi:1-acyl-sn-glycerol-3-phosphate acyltransferase